jgi:hypothetical protein
VVANLVILTFLAVQTLDTAFTYLGVHAWGLTNEGNVLITSATAALGPLAGLSAFKLWAIGGGMFIHLVRTKIPRSYLADLFLVTACAFYAFYAIGPWLDLLFLNPAA